MKLVAQERTELEIKHHFFLLILLPCHTSFLRPSKVLLQSQLTITTVNTAPQLFSTIQDN